MDMQTKKLHFVQDFLRLDDEGLIDKFLNLLRSERKRQFDEKIKKFNINELNDMINLAEDDSKAGRLKTARDLKDEIDSWD